MKILHIIPTLGGGGAERFVVDLINEQVKNHQVYLCTLYDLKSGVYDYFLEELSKEVKLISLGKNLGLDFRLYNKVRKMLLSVQPDIVNTHLNSINYIFPFSLLFKKSLFFHTIHSNAQFEIKHILEFRSRRYFYKKKLIRPITVSRQSQISFRELYKLEIDKLIYNGRREPLISERIDEAKTEVLQLKQKDTTRVLSNIGRFASVKRQYFLAQVVDELIKNGHDICLLFIGDYNSNEGKKIADQIRGLNNPYIHLLGARRNVIDYFSCSDAICISSENEGLPISFIEALSVGCIPISTPVGGLVDFISPSTGFLATDLSKESYKEAVLNFLKENNLDSMSTLNKKLYNDQFNISSVSKKYINLYESRK